MGYELRAVIGRRDATVLVEDAFSLESVALTDEISLIPWRDEDFDALGPSDDELDMAGFWFSHHRLTAELASSSVEGDLLYVEAEFFGGTGEQGAALFRGGTIVWSRPMGPIPRHSQLSPISDGLSRIGVEQWKGLDEFEVLDLGRHRSTVDWLRPPDVPATKIEVPSTRRRLWSWRRFTDR